MRIRINHEIRYRYDAPAKRIIRTLRLTPRNHDGQYVTRWRLEVSSDCRLERQEDAFGNFTHTFALAGDVEKLTIQVTGEVETEDRNGIVRGTVERFPHALFLRDSELAHADPALRAFTDACAAGAEGDTLGALHAVLAGLNETVTYAPDRDAMPAPVADVFAAKRATAAELTHLFIAAARHLGVPARYVSGYLCHNADLLARDACHAWAEAHVPKLGWIGFDPVNGICVTDAFVRIAVGLDELGALAIRGSAYGGGGEATETAIRVEQAMAQSQT